MKLDGLWNIDQLRDFLEVALEVAFAVLTSKDERYRLMQQTLIKFGYRRLSNADKGIVIRYLMKTWRWWWKWTVCMTLRTDWR